MPSALHESLAAAHARMGEYRGAATAASFGDTAGEYCALRSGCAVYDLGWRSKLRVSGADRVRWMNGMVTNNVRDLGPDHGVYCFLLNPQGRIQADMYIYNRGDYLLIDTDQSQSLRLREVLDRYIIMDDVTLAPAGEQLTAVGVGGPQASEILGKVGLHAAALAPLELRDQTLNGAEISLLRSDRPNAFEVWCSPTNAAAIWNALVAAGATPAGSEALELARVAAGIPGYGQDIRERDLPHETGQQRALNFQKGCYVGQEIVERIHSRGNVHRQFTGFELAASLPAPGAKVLAEGKEVGEITSVASLPTTNGDRNVALGYIRREFGSPGTKVHIGEAVAAIAPLPLEKL